MFQLERLERIFETVLYCGLFHNFDSDERPRYATSLASGPSTMEPGMCCASVTMVPILARTGPDIGLHPHQSGRA